MNAEELRQHLIDELTAADQPVPTSVLLAKLNSGNTFAGRPIVIEQVYRGLSILANHGLVRRVPGHPGRSTRWALTRGAR